MTESLGHLGPPPQERPASTTLHDRYSRTFAEGYGLERTLAFSDAVFAIAMTLLVLELRVPEVDGAELAGALASLLPQFLTFVLSFAVVGMVWLSHHRKFRYIGAYDQGLLRLNLLMLLFVAALALPTGLLGRFGNEVLAVVLYASAVSAVGCSMVALWLYAWGRGLIDEQVSRPLRRYVLLQSLPIPVAFVISIPIALAAGADAGKYAWLLALPLAVAVRIIGRRTPAPKAAA